MIRFFFISSLALLLSGCTKADIGAPPPIDPINRFVASYTNLQGSFVWYSTDVSSSASAEEALAKLATAGLQLPRITNFTVVEVRALRPQEPRLAERLTNSVAALVDTEIGQKIILLRKLSGEWSYHVYDAK